MKLKRRDFHELSVLRVKEAQVLLDSGCWAGAYYLAGYAVECAFKACIARTTERYDFPDKETVNKSYTHNLRSLLETARLSTAFQEAAAARPGLARNWTLVTQWSEETRYQQRAEADARALLNAVQEQRNGVLTWLKTHW